MTYMNHTTTKKRSLFGCYHCCFVNCLLGVLVIASNSVQVPAWVLQQRQLHPLTVDWLGRRRRRRSKQRHHLHNPSEDNQEIIKRSHMLECMKSSSSCLFSSAGTTDSDIDDNNNHMFYNYDKPLVLMGCSGAGDELERLAMAFVRQHQQQQQPSKPSLAQGPISLTTTTSTALQEEEESYSSSSATFSSMVGTTGSGDGATSFAANSDTAATANSARGIISLLGYDDGGSSTNRCYVMPLQELKRNIVIGKYAWPDVIVMDLSKLDDVEGYNNNDNNNVGIDSESSSSSTSTTLLESYFVQAMQMLHDELHLLCVYVNVNGTASCMKGPSQRRKERLEHDHVWVQYSDYELCIQQEGLDPVTVVAQQLVGDLQQQQQQDEESSSTTTPPPTTTTTSTTTNAVSLDDVLQSYAQLSSSSSSSSEHSIMLKEAIQQQELGWNHIEWELQRLVARARLTRPIPGDGASASTDDDNNNSGGLIVVNRPENCAHLTMGPHTFFVSLSMPTVEQVLPHLPEMCRDVDALEYRTDLLQCRNSRFQLLYGMQQLRQHCRPHVVRVPALPCGGGGRPSKALVLDDVMPIVYTVRTCHQAGTYPDDPDVGIPNMFTLLTWGLRGGVEVLDVEAAWDPDRTRQLLDLVEQRYSSQILGSHHVVGKVVPLEEAVTLFQQCALQGRAHAAKLVLSIDTPDQDELAHQAALISTSLAKSSNSPVIPHIGLILGKVGQYSRIINLPFTPVTHESLPTPAAPGQLTANEIMATRLLLNNQKLMDKKQYCILGHGISYSVSPQMHQAAFEATRLPHSYPYRADVATVEEFVTSDFFASSDFGGASVTIPHKQAIIPYVDVMSEAARIIGSVNTLIVKEELHIDEGDTDDSGDNRDDGSDNNNDSGLIVKRVVYGDNTDWRGIYKPLQRRLGIAATTTTTVASVSNSGASGVCLIIGAGGTARAAAYAAQQLGLQRIYYNRTPEKAQELADSFGGIVVSSLEEGQVPRFSNWYNDDNGRDNKNDNDSWSSDKIPLGEALWKLGDDNRQAANVRVVISTLPASANFELPNWLYGHNARQQQQQQQLQQQFGKIESTATTEKPKSVAGAASPPIVLDVNYKPYYTQLLLQAESMGCSIVRGSEMLWEQGVGQFELWTGRTAPYRVMKQVVLDNCLPAEEEDNDVMQDDGKQNNFVYNE